ncbi:Panthothenate synthetase [Pseudomonas batumici]|uniref:Panthothenate synthetase n=2 Tax=Pseudomonas TaxID=286 RepID=A0A0C2IFU0_9PSED|nr:panthothenate synthetase [Pseudomonas batumici]KIH83757.1 Panthothenate synthetase [Pseudomonas batumici]
MMKMLLMVEFPNEPFNALVRSGKIGEIMGRILESIKPETAYFTEQEGMRGGIFLINVQDSSEIPSFAEPFFLNFEATCKFRLAMNPQDLQRAGLDALGKTWG